MSNTIPETADAWLREAMVMDFVDLIVQVCLLANPLACEERHLLFESHGSLAACIMQAQPYLAQWGGQHPGLRIAGYRCAWPGDEIQDD